MNRLIPVALAFAALTAGCASAAEVEVPQPSPTAIDSSPTATTTQPPATPDAATLPDVMEAPLETSSPTGTTVRLIRFETGTDCLKL